MSMRVADAIGATLAEAGVDVVFGLIGSGNLVVANAMRDAGIRFYGARHESNAAAMADGYARATGRVAAVSVHQGPGFTNTLTHVTEAAKSGTPMLVVAADTPAATLWSNFKIDQGALARETGAGTERVRSAETAGEDAIRALRRARDERRPIVLNVPIDLVGREGASVGVDTRPIVPAPAPAADAVAAVVELIAASERPAIVAGRGAALAGARAPLEALGQRIGAVLATSGGAHGLFAGSPYSLGIAGGFSSPLAFEQLGVADLVLAFGASLNHWTAHKGQLFAPSARVVQVDVDASALGALHRVDVAVEADARETARALIAELERRELCRGGFRANGLGAEAIARRRWRDEAYAERSTAATIDPRTLTIALDDMLPTERTIATDGGHFLGFPSMYLTLPDERGFVFPQAFQGIGQGLGAAIGAAVGRPDRLTVAALGDGGTLMALSDLETVARYALPMLILVYNDAAYGAEAHHFEPMGHAVDLVRFQDTDLAAVARALGLGGVTVRTRKDLQAVERWLEDRDGPLLVDAKVNPDVRAEWLAAAFSDH